MTTSRKMANSPPLLDSPWRSMEWSDKKKKFLLEKIERLRLGNFEVNTLRILLHGPVGAGKSSFFNSVDSAFKGRFTGRALADSMSGISFTIKPRIYKLKMEETTLPIELIDTRGMENTGGIGMKIDDIVRILQAHFENESDEPKNAENNKPLKDKIHCLVSVLPANNISLIEEDVIIEMRNIHLKARDFGIPQAMIVTKVDEACPEVQKNIKNIYSSRKIKQKMEECCQRLGVPMSHIYPVKNYYEEQTTNTEIDILILQGMLNIVNFAKDYVDDQISVGFKIKDKDFAKMPFFKRRSDSPPSAPPPQEYDEPWRKIDWKSKNLLETLNNFQPVNSDENPLRILLHGPVGAGKSSFINSVDSCLKGRITTRAVTNSVLEGGTFTLECKTFKFKKTDSFYPFTLTDICGLEDKEGVQAEDIIKLLNGHIRNDYTFNSAKAISEEDPKYNKNPSLKDKIHCLVSVLSANSITRMDKNEGVIRKMKEVRRIASNKGIPQAIIMTKVDEACPLVKANLKEKIYTSKKMKEKMELCSSTLGVPVSYIYPVKNYHEEHTTNDTADFLILDALQCIVNFANDYVKDQVDKDSL